MADVLFKKGLQAGYNAIEQKVATTFYYTTDEKNLYLGDVKISNDADLKAAIARITANEANITALQDLTRKLDGDADVDGSIKKQIKDAIAASEAKLATVATSGKATDVTVEDVAGKYDATNVEAVLAEIATKISTTSGDSKVTLETASKDDADKAGYAGVYTFKQGGKLIGTINIAKDMVATSGELVKADGDGNEGTFIKMTIANGTPFYINVKDLIEYNAVESTDEIILTDNNHTISATVKEINGSKITDGSIVKGKLDTNVQGSLDKADSALQQADVTTGTTNGAIAVKGTDVQIAGLKSAAFVDTTTFDAAGAADTVKTALEGGDADTAESKTIAGAKKYADNLIEESLTWGAF